MMLRESADMLHKRACLCAFVCVCQWGRDDECVSGRQLFSSLTALTVICCTSYDELINKLHPLHAVQTKLSSSELDRFYSFVRMFT